MARVLAFDFGASSGRAMIGAYAGRDIAVREIHRFSNDPVNINGTLYWDVLRLFFEIKQGISKAVQDGGFDTVGIDTWGVDFGLIGNDGQLVCNPVHYRDKRTDGYKNLGLYQKITPERIYQSTGIQEIQFNTLNQLAYLAEEEPDQLARANKLLFTPDLLNYFLTGEMKTEYTIASTSQMLDAKRRDWDYRLIGEAGIDPAILCEITMPGNICGTLRPEIQEELNAPPAKVVCIASHDTASAVSATPTQKKRPMYISSGTWSLMGTELSEPVLSREAWEYNFTNEGGAGRTICYLRNIMGAWLNQECRRQWIREGREYSFSQLDEMAGRCVPFQSFIDVDAPDFMRPGNMPRRIREYCARTGQLAPETEGEVIRCIDESLALKYRNTAEGMEKMAGFGNDTIHILGGGANSALLCQMAANATGKDVLAGPTEATVLGNIMMQLIAAGEVQDIREARAIVARTEELRHYAHKDGEAWDAAYARYQDLAQGRFL